MKMYDDRLEIYLEDLSPEAIEAVYETLGDDGNFNVFPMITLYKHVEDK